MMPRILVLEDDALQARELERLLQKELQAEVSCIPTELEFRKRTLANEISFDLAVVDMMLRWTDPAPDMELPDASIITQGLYSAGLRCCALLKKAGIPCVIYTALDPENVPQESGYPVVNKNLGNDVLLMEIRQLLGRR